MKLYLLRHGNAANTYSSGTDFDRSLTTDGIMQAMQINEILKSHLTPSVSILCSEAKRAVMTLEKVKKGLNVDRLVMDLKLYLASHQEIINSIIQHFPVLPAHLLCIGHNGGISHLVNYLTDENIILPTCGLAIIDLPECDNPQMLSQGVGTLLDVFESPI